MGTTVYPVDAVSGAPLYSGRKLRQTMAPLLAGATSARPLGARSGIRHGSGTVVTATSTTWTVTPHAGVLEVEDSAAAGPYGYAVDDSANTGTVAAADGTNPRIDIVWVQLADPAEGDGSSAPAVTFGYTAGAAAASPAAPAVPARAMALAQISVPKAGGGSPTVAMVAPLLPTFLLPVRTQAERDAIPSPANGTLVLRLDTGQLERFDGSAWGSAISRAWTAYTPGLSGITLGNGTLKAYYSQVGKTITARLRLVVGSTTTFTATTLRFQLPAPYGADYDQVTMGAAYLLDSSAGSASRTIAATVATGGDTVFLVAATAGGTVTNLVPWTWADGDIITFTATYETS